MRQIKRLINCQIPLTACNLNCSYCYVSHHRTPRNYMVSFQYSPEYIGKALSVKRLGGVCLMNLCGEGETLIPKELPRIIEELLKQGHYLEVVTNGTLTHRFNEIIKMDRILLSRLEFKFSFHYMELNRKKMTDVFFDNINLVKKSGCSFTVEITPHDELIPYIDDIKRFSLKKVGALPHLTVARDEANSMRLLTRLSRKEFVDTWNTFESPMFNFKMSTFGVKRKEYCYAGDWVLNVRLDTGNTKQCYCTRFEQNIFENINKPIAFLPIGNNCRLPHCMNSHALLTLGAIPEINGITYADVRNRKCDNGSEWLRPNVKKFFCGKLYESNKQFGSMQKAINEALTYGMKVKNHIEENKK